MRVILLLVIILLFMDPGLSLCKNPKKIYLTGPNGVIQTPNFPNRFKTPLCIHWIIDSQQPYSIFNESGNHFSNGKRIRIYLTQLYLKENLTFVDYIKYPYPNGQTLHENEQNSVRRNHEILETGFSRIPLPRSLSDENNNSSTIVSAYATELRFLGIQLDLLTPYAKHFRATNFLHTYGFNITYNIVDETHHEEDFNKRESCSLSNCSFAGNCYVSSDYRRFSCSCHPGRHGEYCEYMNETCDPRHNITFCRNGGSCKMQAPGVGVCYCPPGFTGQLCGLKMETSVKECPGPECEEVCGIGSESSHRPCSCHKGRNIPKGAGWMRYEVMLQALEFLPVQDFRAESIPADHLKRKTEMERSLKEKLKKVPGLEGIDTSVAVVSFGDAAKIYFQFFGPNETTKNEKVIKEVLTNGSLLPLQKLSDTFVFNPYPALALTKLFRDGSPTPLKVGEPFDLHCVAEGSATIKFKWFKEGVPIDKALATREINEQSYVQPKFVSKSILMFTSSTLEDRGVFTCQVSDMGEEQCLEISVSVVAPPYIILDPMSLTVDKGEEDRVLTCISENESPKHNFTYNWEKNGRLIVDRGHWTNEVIEDLHPYGSLLRIALANTTANYACVVTNYAGTNVSSVYLNVLESQYLAFCPRNLDNYGMEWDRTAVGQMAKRWCPSGFLGFAQRSCKNSNSSGNPIPKWEGSNFCKCVSKELRELSRYMRNLRMGYGNKTQIFDLTQRLVEYLARKTFLYNGEGETIIEVLEDIGNFAIHKKSIIAKSGDQFLRSFLNATTQFLRFPGSCSLESSVMSIGILLRNVATKFPTESNPFLWESDLFVLEKLQIMASPFSHPFRFPMTGKAWASEIVVRIPNSINGSRANDATVLVFAAFRNLTAIYSTPTNPHNQFPSTPSTSYQVETPIILINSFPNFVHSAPLHLTFNLSSNLVTQIQGFKKNLTCGGMEASRHNTQISWTPNACSADEITNSTVECICEHFGYFALLAWDVGMSYSPEQNWDIHWSIIVGTVVLVTGCGLAMIYILIHIEFQSERKRIQSRTPEKNFENGQVSSILLPGQNDRNIEPRERATTFDSINSGQLSEADTTMETIGGSSILSTSSSRRDSIALRAYSVSDKRPSLISNGTTSICRSISRSLTNPAQSNSASSSRPLLHQNQVCAGICRRGRKERSFSCGGGSCGPIKPDRGRCLLREIEAADYVLPSKPKHDETTSPQAQPSPENDLCPTTGYIDVAHRRANENIPEFSTFEPKFLQPNPIRKGSEALYESIKYESVKDALGNPGVVTYPTQGQRLLNSHILNGYHDDGILNLTPAVPCTYQGNGTLRGHGFKKTDPLPPTPTEFLAKNQLEPRDKLLTKSDPNFKGTIKGLDYLMEKRLPKNGFHTLPVGAQSLH